MLIIFYPELVSIIVDHKKDNDAYEEAKEHGHGTVERRQHDGITTGTRNADAKEYDHLQSEHETHSPARRIQWQFLDAVDGLRDPGFALAIPLNGLKQKGRPGQVDEDENG